LFVKVQVPFRRFPRDVCDITATRPSTIWQSVVSCSFPNLLKVVI